MKSTRKLAWLLPLVIFLLSLSTRAYKLPEVFPYGADEEYQSTYARTISDDFHLVWIGVSAANTGFYLGPFWTYLTAGLITVSSDPLIAGYFAAFLGAITAATIYLVGKDLLNKRAGLIAAIFYSLSPLVVYFDQKYWNPSSLPLLSILLLYSALKIKSNHNWLYLFVVCVGLIFHVHLSLVPVALVLFIFAFRDIAKVGWRKLALSIILFLLTISPLIVFDYYHDYSNITTPLRWSKISSDLPNNSVDNAKRATSMLGRLWFLVPGLSSGNEARPVCSKGSTTTPHVLLVFLSLLPVIIFTLSSNQGKKNKWGLLLSSLALILPFIFYPGKNSEYYLLGLIPLYALIVGSTLARLKGTILYPLLLAFSLLAGRTIVNNDPAYGLSAKHDLIQETTSYLNGADFTLTEEGECHKYEGWRYLFTVYGDRPLRSSIDNSYGWLYEDEISSSPAKYSVTIYGTGGVPDVNAEYFYSGGFTAIVKELN